MCSIARMAETNAVCVLVVCRTHVTIHVSSVKKLVLTTISKAWKRIQNSEICLLNEHTMHLSARCIRSSQPEVPVAQLKKAKKHL
jgi:hypothetical protein